MLAGHEGIDALTLRQLCNVSFVAQLETKTEAGQRERWMFDLNDPPPELKWRADHRRHLTRIDASLDSLMPAGVA